MNKASRKSINRPPIQSLGSDLFDFKSPHYKKLIDEWTLKVAEVAKVRKKIQKAGLTVKSAITIIDSIQGPMLPGKGSMTMTYKIHDDRQI